jgi:hypothetical protein
MLTAADRSVGFEIWLPRQRQMGGRPGIERVDMTRGGLCQFASGLFCSRGLSF